VGGTPEPSIRSADGPDAEALAGVHARASRAAFSSLVPADVLTRIASVEARVELWTERLAAPPLGTHAYVAEVAGRIVGLVDVGPSRDDDHDPGAVGEVGVLYVDPAHWGRGIGRELLEHAVDRLRSRGLASATLWTLATSTRTRSFYEWAGWRLDGAERPLLYDASLTEVRYELPLRDGP